MRKSARIHDCSVLNSIGDILQLIKSISPADHRPVYVEMDINLHYDRNSHKEQWDFDKLMAGVLKGRDKMNMIRDMEIYCIDS